MNQTVKQPVVTDLKEGVLLVNKPQGRTSFSLIRALRKLTGIKKIGHAGTLDPFATGVMIMLIGRSYTRFSDKMLIQDKQYLAQVCFGITTDTFDCDGKIVARSKKSPTVEEIHRCIGKFQGEIQQVPPMFSAKKIRGKKLYELARKGEEIERAPATVQVKTDIISYEYPYLSLNIECSKGTYIRSIAHELGQFLGCGAHLSELQRTRSGLYSLDECIDGNLLDDPKFDITPFLKILPHESI